MLSGHSRSHEKPFERFRHLSPGLVLLPVDFVPILPVRAAVQVARMNTISTVAWISRRAGGLQDSVRRLHQSLNEIPGVKVSVAALRDSYSVKDVLDWSPLPVSLSQVVGPLAFGFSPGLSQKLLQANADILHSNGLWQYPSVAVNRWHKKTGRPYVVSPHGMLDPWAIRNSGWKKKIALAGYERKHLEGASCIRALCGSEAQAIRKFGLPNPICIIPNGIDLPEKGDGKTGIGNPPWSGSIEPGQKVLLYLGRIHPKKGLVNLIRAWAKNRKPGNWVLAVAGWDQGGHEAELKHLATELGLAWSDIRKQNGENHETRCSVLFLGPQFNAAKAACYYHCDAFILPSVSEGLPMVVLEAWAYGKPVLMTSQCNLPEGFAAKAAIQIEPGLESIAAGLDSLFSTSDDHIQKLGQNGLSLATARFNWAGCANEMVEVYRWLLGNGTKPATVV
jgi:glycosyltransferase involved in cell wall biosynthesis